MTPEPSQLTSHVPAAALCNCILFCAGPLELANRIWKLSKPQATNHAELLQHHKLADRLRETGQLGALVQIERLRWSALASKDLCFLRCHSHAVVVLCTLSCAPLSISESQSRNQTQAQPILTHSKGVCASPK